MRRVARQGKIKVAGSVRSKTFTDSKEERASMEKRLKQEKDELSALTKKLHRFNDWQCMALLERIEEVLFSIDEDLENLPMESRCQKVFEKIGQQRL